MMFEEIVQKRREEAIEEGRIEGLIETAKNMLDNDISAELVAKCTNLPLEQVLQLQKELMSAVAK